jgi:hypothetical protein
LRALLRKILTMIVTTKMVTTHTSEVVGRYMRKRKLSTGVRQHKRTTSTTGLFVTLPKYMAKHTVHSAH